jgi:hypothetical protein
MHVAMRQVLVVAAMVVTAAAASPMMPVAGQAPCHVRNVTRDTQGRSFRLMVAAAVDGDRLRVRGVCASRGVVIGTDLSIQGAGVDRAVLHGGGHARVLRVMAGASVVLRHVKVTRGNAQHGGGILNHGDLTIEDAVVQWNTGSGGGGIVSRGRLRLRDSIVRRNQAWFGAGIHVAAGSARVARSRVAGNTVVDQGSGGGILSAGHLTVVGSVIVRNRADLGGGAGIASTGRLALVDSTVRANTARSFSADFGGGGGIQNGGTLALIRSSVMGNSIGGPPGGGGGIFSWTDATVTLDRASSVIDNSPDDCVGTDAC